VTRQRRVASAVAAVVVAGLLIALAALVQESREARYPLPSASGESLYVTSGPVARHLTAGYETLAADLYWIRAIQYYGKTKLRLSGAAASSASDPGKSEERFDRDENAESDYSLLYPMLDLTTTLDPRFNIAYRFGAIFLAEPRPGGAGRPDLALALLEKGLRERADKWEYMQDAGFVHYWWRQDYKAAAEWFDRASRVPGAPWWLQSLSASTLAEGGDRRSSRLMWEAIFRSAEIDWLRSDAERHLAQLTALDEIDALQAAVDAAAARGVVPITWFTLLRAGVLRGEPIDPAGTPYELDPDGRVQLSPQSSLYPPPREPQRLAPLS